jgi:heat shock protein HslJ
MKKLFGMLMVVTLLTACSVSTVEEEDFNLEGSWKVVSLNGEGVPSELMITLNIDSTLSVNGKAACNSYFGNIEVKNDSVTFGRMGATRMMCDELKNRWEMEYHSVLSKPLFIESKEKSAFVLVNAGSRIELKKSL